MNRLSVDKQSQIVSALVEGNSINATCRMLGVGKHTVLRLLRNLGCACAAYHDSHVRNLRVAASSVTKCGRSFMRSRRTSRLSRCSKVRATYGRGQQFVPTQN